MFETKKTKVNRLFPEAGLTRGVGTSTAQALSYISMAIAASNEWIQIIDHHGTPGANKALMFLCKSIVHDLDLKYFSFEYLQSSGAARIRCDIFAHV